MPPYYFTKLHLLSDGCCNLFKYYKIRQQQKELMARSTRELTELQNLPDKSKNVVILCEIKPINIYEYAVRNIK